MVEKFSKVLLDMVNPDRWRYLAVSLIALAMVVVAGCSPTGSTSTLGTSFFGPMALYESAEHPFSIQYPAEWIEHPDIQDEYGIPVWRTDSKGEWFVVVQGSTVNNGSLSAYVDWVISSDKKTDKQHEMVSREQTKTVQGLPAELIEYTISWGGEPMTVNALIYLHDNKVGFRAAYGVFTPRYEGMKDMIAYSFSTFSFSTFKCNQLAANPQLVPTPVNCQLDQAKQSR